MGSHRRTGRQLRLECALASSLLVLPGLAPRAGSHPLGNFTVNRYARLELGRQSLVLVYLVDWAEVPAFQELKRFPGLAAAADPAVLARAPEADPLGRDLARAWTAGLRVSAGGRPVDLVTRDRRLEFSAGEGGMPTMKLHLRLEGAWPAGGEQVVAYEDANAPDRLGWREIVLVPSGDLRVVDATASPTDRSNALRSYPRDPAASFPQDTRASFRAAGLEAGAMLFGADGATRIGTASAKVAGGDRLAALLHADRLTLRMLLVALAAAFALGALHALSPGHGKTITAAYLVGSRGTARHALLLGAVVTAAHTVGVFALGVVTLALSASIVPEKLYPVIELVSGLLIVAVGVTMFVQRLRGRRHVHVHAHGAHGEHGHDHAHGHDHDHDHGHDHGHSHAIPEGAPTTAALVALGVSGGILPCPSALVVLLTAIALHRVALGLVLIVAFSLGLAAVLSGIGILVVRAGSLVSRLEPAAGLVRAVPVVSAGLVSVLGLVLAAQALVDLGRALP